MKNVVLKPEQPSICGTGVLITKGLAAGCRIWTVLVRENVSTPNVIVIVMSNDVIAQDDDAVNDGAEFVVP